jgi:hypothetical protein
MASVRLFPVDRTQLAFYPNNSCPNRYAFFKWVRSAKTPFFGKTRANASLGRARSPTAPLRSGVRRLDAALPLRGSTRAASCRSSVRSRAAGNGKPSRTRRRFRVRQTSSAKRKARGRAERERASAIPSPSEPSAPLPFVGPNRSSYVKQLSPSYHSRPTPSSNNINFR